MKSFLSVVFISLFLIGCSDDGNNDNSMPATGEIANDGGDGNLIPDIVSQDYMDSTISLRYPDSWLVNPNGQIINVDAQFTSPQTNATGGVDNCTFTYAFDPSASLMDAVDEALSLFDSVPEPRVDFFEVNTVPAARVTGSVTSLNIRVPSIAQVMIRDGQLVFSYCGGSSNEQFELILRTITFK